MPIFEQEKFKNLDFIKKLNYSEELVLKTRKILEKKYSNKYFNIITNFDNTKRGIIKLNQLNLNEKLISELKTNISKMYINNNFAENYLKKGLRTFDIAVVELKSNKIVLLVEVKDFAQMVYYEKTGLPYLYLEKLLILKKIFEQLENSKIQTLLVFRDNKELENERLKKNLNNLKLFKFKNKFDPYFVEFTLENVNLKT